MSVIEATMAPVWNDETASGQVFSGHESFACRYGWLPKLYEALSREPGLFASDERAILELGLGRNMVKSLRFWGDAFGLTRTEGRQVVLTEFAQKLLDPVNGRDPYLEEAGSLWRLHWNITTSARLGAWTTLFLDLHDLELSRDRLLSMVIVKAALGSPISSNTAAAHVDILLKTYDSSRQARGVVVEDALGCPLQELDLLRTTTPAGVPTVRLNRGPKPDLDLPSFAYALQDFWSGTAPRSQTLSMRSLTLARRSPGAVFRLDEASLHERLEAVCAAAPKLKLREDGAGGLDIVSTGKTGPMQLEAISW